MVFDGIIEGRYVKLRSAMVEDAQVTLEMRQNKKKTRFLHVVDNDIDKQIEWIKNQRKKEGDYFFVVLDHSDKIIGMMGIYEIKGDKGHNGRLLMYGNALQSIEAYYLLYKFGFEELGLSEIYGDTDIENKSALKFSLLYGMKYGEPVYDKEMDRYVRWGTISRDDFNNCNAKIEKMIYR